MGSGQSLPHRSGGKGQGLANLPGVVLLLIYQLRPRSLKNILSAFSREAAQSLQFSLRHE
jgi:hypothetical protein